MTARGDVMRWLLAALNYDDDKCLLFPFGKFADGYGAVWVSGRMVGAHRFVCESEYGPPSSSHLQAAHSCGVRACVNKRHLRWATSSENEADKINHGRSNRGERQGGSKLALHEVLKIRAAQGKQRTIARQFGVSEQTVSAIKNGRRWSWA